jgi:hypothetical protein
VPEKTKLQVPIDKKVYTKLKKTAEQLGFDSVQAYVRFWAAGVTGESAGEAIGVSGGQGSGGLLNKPSQQALRYLELVLAMAEEEPKSAEAALKHVEAHLAGVKLGKHLNALL